MKQNQRKLCREGLLWLGAFVLWTWLVLHLDVRPAGESGTNLGFSTFNCWFHALTGVHMGIYTATDWLGLVPVFVCMVFAALGLAQLIRRKSLKKVDRDLLLLGFYYILVILCYLGFEMVPINFRPILIEGRMEASYPSSTTLLVLSVMPTLVFQTRRRVRHKTLRRGICLAATVFSLAMVLGRLVSGVHWFTDIIGSVCFSAGLFRLYQAAAQ